MKLKAPRYGSAQFVTRFMYKSDVAGFAIGHAVVVDGGQTAGL